MTHTNRRAISLIELLVALSIVAVLASLLSATFVHAQPGPQRSAPLAAASDSPAGANAGGKSQTGETLLRSAVAAMEAHQAVSAKLRQQVDLFGHHLIGSGGDIFMVVGKQADFQYVKLNQAAVLDSGEEEEISADDLDFDLMGGTVVG